MSQRDLELVAAVLIEQGHYYGSSWVQREHALRDATAILQRLAGPAAEKEPGEAQSATPDLQTHRGQGAVLSGRSDSPTEGPGR